MALLERLSQMEDALIRSKQVPAEFLNARFLQIPGYKIRLVAQEMGVYNAFPGGVQRFGDYIVGIFSSGAGHANSDRQRWVKSKNGFVTFETGTFFENATLAHDTSFLEGLISEGESANFKTVFTVKNEGGTLAPYRQATIDVSGDTYAFWGEPKFIGDRWFGAAYRTAGGYRRAALFESTDGMVTWVYKSMIAAAGARLFGETSFDECANGDWVAVTRDDPATNIRDLYIERSTDQGATWSTPVKLPSHVVGTQPFVKRLSNGHLMLFAGDRTGSGGLNNVGAQQDFEDITGVSCWKSTDNGLTWGPRIHLAPSWSTDCGQYVPVELEDGNVLGLCYLSPGATNGTRGIEPGIYAIEFDPAGIPGA